METFIQPKITGYRQLSEAEANLMNGIKAAGADLDDLVMRVLEHLLAQREGASAKTPEGLAEIDRLDVADPHRWAAMALTDLQVGLMKLTRAVAQPTSF